MLVLKGQYIKQARITAWRETISLWEGVLVMKGQYIKQARITAWRETISLWEGVLVMKGPMHRTSYNNSFERDYFTLGGCTGPDRKLKGELLPRDPSGRE